MSESRDVLDSLRVLINNLESLDYRILALTGRIIEKQSNFSHWCGRKEKDSIIGDDVDILEFADNQADLCQEAVDRFGSNGDRAQLAEALSSVDQEYDRFFREHVRYIPSMDG